MTNAIQLSVKEVTSGVYRWTSLDYKSNEELQRWILTHLGITESENPYTGSQGAINVWQVSKLIPPEILPTIDAYRTIS